MTVPPVRIKSPDHPIALVVYAAISLFGVVYLVSDRPGALSEFLTPMIARALMLVVAASGTIALTAAILAGRARDPIDALTFEIRGLWPLVVVLGLYLASLLFAYGLTIPTTLIFAAAFFIGPAFRLRQARRERGQAVRARQAVKAQEATRGK